MVDVLIFPLEQRVGKVRNVAKKLAAKATDRHAEFYRDQVTAALLSQLERIGLPKPARDEQLTEFWRAVQAEMIRQVFRGNRPGGSVA